MNGYGAVGDARKRMLDGHENYSAEVWRERAQEQAHRASQAEAKVAELRAEVADLRDRLAGGHAALAMSDHEPTNRVWHEQMQRVRAALGDADTLAEGCGAAWLQPEPPEHVLAVTDYTADAAPIDDSPQWGRTTNGEWKGYKDGGKEYLDWPELCRRWGPLTWDEGATDERC